MDMESAQSAMAIRNTLKMVVGLTLALYVEVLGFAQVAVAKVNDETFTSSCT